LDGTLLKTPSKEDLLKNIPNYDINPLNIKVLKKLIDKGHKVAIVTGRP
jgi:hydroxymethylpyrimidine pyrophosphatase-like HAD family hydrolase